MARKPSSPRSSTSPRPGKRGTRTIWTRFKDVTKGFLFLLLPPVLISFLLKSTALLTVGVFLFQGITYFTSDRTLSPVITTLDGAVQGNIGYSRNGTAYWQYLSIPYAQPPVGPLRFQPPVPVLPWKGVKQTVHYPPACVQFEPVALAMTWGVEDCLFLNVFAPKNAIPTGEKSGGGAPVLVYIHGGAFLQGESSSYRPDYIMDQNVVLVTLNYRLGPLGFLNLQEKNDISGKYPRGNMGLKDQNLVLRWIQKNIAKFGGDPTQVTVMAESAGAVSVHLHMLSPMSRGLFHKAIPISGSALCPWGFTEYPRKIAFEYGSRLGCPTGNANSLFQCFMDMDPHEMVRLQYSWSDPLHVKDEFIPSVEAVGTEDAFLTDTPLELLRKGDSIADIPLLTGVTSGEGVLRSGRFLAMPESVPLLDQNWGQLIDKALFLDDPLPSELALQLRQYYFGNMNFTQDVRAFFEAMTKLSSDSLFVGPVNRAAVYHAKRGNPTYLFFYDYRPALLPATLSAFSQASIHDNFAARGVKLLGGVLSDWIEEHVFGGEGAHAVGIGHAEPMFQIFNFDGFSKWITRADMDFSTSFVQAIADFVHDSKPLTFRGEKWPQINKYVQSNLDDLPYMKLDRKPAVIKEPFKERLQFWETLRSTYSKI